MNFKNEKTFKEMVSKYGLNLFIGAGFSILSKNKNDENLKTSIEITEDIISYFNLAKFRGHRLSKIISHLNKTKLGEFTHFLKEKYTIDNSYPKEYNSITNLPLKNIFTTNIDNLIECIFNSLPNGKYVEDAEILGRTESPAICFFKFHGSITYPYDKKLVFSTEDIATTILKDPGLLYTIGQKIVSIPTLFWGTSLSDTDVIQILEPTTLKNRNPMPKWIVVHPDKKHDIDAEEFESSGFNIIRADTQSLLDYMNKNYSYELFHFNTPKSETKTNLSSIFPQNEYISILSKKHPVQPLADFFNGNEPGWDNIMKGNIQKLSYYSNLIEEINSKNNILIYGSPGSGKTTLLKQLFLSKEIQGTKLYFPYLTENESKTILKYLNNNALVFIDNLSNNLSGYNILSKNKNIQLICADRDVSFEQVRNHLTIEPEKYFDISDLEDVDIQNIYNSLQKPKINFLKEKVSLFEIVFSVWANSNITTKIQELIEQLSKEKDLLELYTLLTYMRYTNIYASMDSLLSYYADDETIDYKRIYDLIQKMSSLVDNNNFNFSDDPQDYFSLRSHIFSEQSIPKIPSETLKKVLTTFHIKVHRSRISRYDIFRRKAFDADLTYYAFPETNEGIDFYSKIIFKNKDNSQLPYVYHQYAIYLLRKKKKEEAWEAIDIAYTKSNGNIFTINNTHAMILFENNIARVQDENDPYHKTLENSFNTLKKCLELDNRKSYHISKYAEQALAYFEKFNNDFGKTLLVDSYKYIKEIIASKKFIPRQNLKKLLDLRQKLHEYPFIQK